MLSLSTYSNKMKYKIIPNYRNSSNFHSQIRRNRDKFDTRILIHNQEHTYTQPLTYTQPGTHLCTTTHLHRYQEHTYTQPLTCLALHRHFNKKCQGWSSFIGKITLINVMMLSWNCFPRVCKMPTLRYNWVLLTSRLYYEYYRLVCIYTARTLFSSKNALPVYYGF